MRKSPYLQSLLAFIHQQRWRVGLLIVFSWSVGFLWLWLTPRTITAPPITPRTLTNLTPGTVAAMSSPVFHYTQSWQITPLGADPQEPADPWQEPAGVLTFTYTGSELALLLAPGDYWGYLYVTVDHAPANLLPVIPGNRDSRGHLAGYRTLYAPERQVDGVITPQWIRVHQAEDITKLHEVHLELWRGWGQVPLRAVAVDALPASPPPPWGGILGLLIGSWLAGLSLLGLTVQWEWHWWRWLQHVALPACGRRLATGLALPALLLIAMGSANQAVLLTWLGLLLLAWCGLQRPALWLAALLFALPFYFHYSLPLLPNRTIGLVDIGMFGGIVISVGHWWLNRGQITDKHRSLTGGWQTMLLAVLASWALLATMQAEQQAVALREWRTIFLYGFCFALLLWRTRQHSRQPQADQQILIGAWLAGGVAVALVALWQYSSDQMLISAEGVNRVRAFYGSPNNLALYLERTLAPTLAFALFTPRRGAQLGWGSLALLQAAALLLTFSKGALLLGLPALLATLWLGGLILLRRQERSPQLLWWLAGAGIVAGLALLPFLGTPRFQRLLDLESGTGFLRLQLWRSSWQMAWDHGWFGVGPDNFLYTYRSYYLLPQAWQEPNLNHPHQWLLDWWTRLGLPGLLLALGWFGLMIRSHWQQVTQGRQALLSLGLLAALAAGLAHGLIDASYALPDLMLVWVLLGEVNGDEPEGN